ncbi:hypothetical protein DFH28DRAFT_923416 [Melampsora americana]|nr:hypothetical protein DFH28DRAFT_923416 [Melampsora americana]
MPHWYRRSLSPEIRSSAVEVVRDMLRQVENYTEGPVVLTHANGDSHNVHIHNNLVYRVQHPNTADAKVVFICLEFTDEPHPLFGEFDDCSATSPSYELTSSFIRLPFLEQCELVLPPDQNCEASERKTLKALLLDQRILDPSALFLIAQR